MMLKEHYDHKQPLNPHLAVSALCHLIEAEDSAVERRNAGRGRDYRCTQEQSVGGLEPERG